MTGWQRATKTSAAVAALTSIAVMLGNCVGGNGARPLVPIVTSGMPLGSTYEYCRIFYGPKDRAESSCPDRMQQCQELLPTIVARLQAIEVPQRKLDKCTATARDNLDERRRRDADFSSLYRSVARGPIRDYDGEAACLSTALGRSDIPSIAKTPAPPICDMAPSATPSSEEMGNRLACEEGEVTFACRGEDEAKRAVSGYDGRVSFWLRKRCSDLARVNASDRPDSFRWTRYVSCLRKSLD